MSDPQNASNEANDLTFAEDSPGLDIDIYPAGDEAGLHIRNDDKNPFQRRAIVQRQGRVRVRCDHTGIVHGYYSDDCDDLYSLIIMEFRFEPNGIAARIKEAHATIQFAAYDKEGRDPEVVNMYPNGMFVVEPRQQHEQSVKSGGLNVSGGPAGVTVAGELKSETTIDRDTTNYTSVRGSIDLLRSYGESNAVSFGLFENPATKTGVVSSLRVAILLKRDDMYPFKAIVTLKATADTHSRIATIFKKDPKDEDVLYNPSKKAPKDLQALADNLGTVDLKSHSRVTFRLLITETTREG